MNPFDKIKSTATGLQTKGKDRIKSAFGRHGSGGGTPAANAPEALKKARQDFSSEGKKANDRLAAMRKLPGAEADTNGVKKHVDDAQKVIDDATTAAEAALTEAQVKTQIDALSKVAEKEKAAKTASEAYVGSHPANLGSFEDKLRAASDRLAKVRAERGASTHPDLKDADNLLDLLKKEARAAATPAEVTKRIDRLKELEPLTKNIETAAKAAKKSAGVNLDAYPKWSKMLASAEEAKATLAKDPLVKEQYDKLCKLLTAAVTTANTGGAAAALTELGKYEEIVKAATDLRAAIDARPLPKEVDDAAKTVAPLLAEYTKLAPAYAVSRRSDRNEELLALGRTQPAESVTGFGQLATSLREEIKTQKLAQAEAEGNLGKLRAKVAQSISDGLDPNLFDFLVEQGQRAVDHDFREHEWQHTTEVLGRVLKDLDDLQAAQGADSKTWLAGAAGRDKMFKRVDEFYKWPPSYAQAQSWVADLKDLEASLKQSGNYTAALAEFKDSKLEERFQRLEQAYADHALHPATPEGLAKLPEEKRAAQALFDADLAKADAAVRKLEARLKASGGSTANPLRDGLGAVQKAWDDYYRTFELAGAPWAGFKAPTGTKPAELAAPFIARLKEIRDEAETADKGSSDFDKFQDTAKAHEAEVEARDMAKSIAGKLDQLESIDGPQAGLRKEFEGLKDDKVSAEVRDRAYKNLRTALQTRIDTRKQENEARVQESRRELKLTVEKPLMKIKGRHKGFEAYQEELEAQAADIAAMVESGDPFLLEQSEKDSARLMKKVSAIDPKQRGDEAARYKEVSAEWERLGNALGKGIRDYLPTTHQDLEAELKRLIGEARASSPALGLGSFKGLSLRIEQAQGRAEAVRKDRAAYKERKERLEQQWARIKKLTNTQVTDKATHFADAFAERLANADAASKTEPDEKSKAKGGCALANDMLAKLEATLAKIERSGDGATARVELQKQDAAIEQESRAIRDLARDFEAQVKFFKETTIPEARKIIEAQNGDLEMLKHLGMSIKQASRPVEPYLKMLSDLPRPGKPKAPELARAKEDFKAATAALTAAGRTVLTLRGGVGDTGIDITGDLKKIDANWREKAKKYAVAAVALADEITAAAADDPDPAVKENAAKAAKLIKEVADDFRPEAFAAQILVLTKKDTAETKAKPRLAAREKALKIMRTNRKTLLEHPVHRQLSTANQVFAGSKVNGAARDVLIALKRLEIEVLVGI